MRIKKSDEFRCKLNSPDNRGDFILSFTSHHIRFPTLSLCINSVINQTLRPKKIVLYVNEVDLAQASIPGFLLDLQSDFFEVRINKSNLRSYGKLVHALTDFPENTIITIDDDLLYPSTILEQLLSKHKEYPRYIVCGNAKVISMNGEGRFLPYMEWPDSHDDAGFQLFPLGFSGVLYPTNSLHKDVTRSDLFAQLAPTNDDHWFKAMSLLVNSPVISLGLTPKDYPDIYIPDDKPLWRINKGPQQDRSDKAVPYDRSWKAILEYYSIEPSIFRPQSPSYPHRDKAVPND